MFLNQFLLTEVLVVVEVVLEVKCSDKAEGEIFEDICSATNAKIKDLLQGAKHNTYLHQLYWPYAAHLLFHCSISSFVVQLPAATAAFSKLAALIASHSQLKNKLLLSVT